MRSFVRNHWPMLASIALLWFSLAVSLLLSIHRTDGHLIYPLDDPYIHMAIAKHYVEDGVWGLTRYAFTSSSSSPIWTLGLAGVYALFGVVDAAPLVMNIAIATVMIGVIYALLKRRDTVPRNLFWVLAIVIAVTPLPMIAITGLEHTLHALLTIILVYYATKVITAREGESVRSSQVIALAAMPFVAAARYEGLFACFAICVLLLFRRRWGFSLMLAAAGFLPLMICGWVYTQHGWYWLPNSVLLKGHVGSLARPEDVAKPIGFAAIALCMILYRTAYGQKKWFWEPTHVMTVICLVCGALQVVLANVRAYFRYEAYLFSLAAFVAGYAWLACASRPGCKADVRSWIAGNKFLAALGAALILGAGTRAVIATARVPRATENIYEQQYQMAMFFKQFYEGLSVAANDVGATNYYADVRCLDLMGLGSLETARMRMHNSYTAGNLLRACGARRVRAAVLYDEWFLSSIPCQWTRVGQWKIDNNVAAAYDTVSFYAVDPLEKPKLIARLRRFSPGLPKGVHESGMYRQ